MKDFWFTSNSPFLKVSSWVYLLVPVFVAIFVGLSHAQSWFDRFDNLLYDNMLSKSKKLHSDDIVIVAIDQLSLDAFGRWPWSRRYHAELTQKLSGSKAVVFDVLFPEVNTEDPIGDQLFAAAIKKHGRVILPVHLEILRNKGQLLEIPPEKIFYSAANSVGHVHAHCEYDSICRSIFLFEGLGSPYWAHISLEADRIQSDSIHSSSQKNNVVLQSLPSSSKKSVLESYYNTQWREKTSNRDAFTIINAHQAFIPFDSTKKPFVEISYVDVLTGNVPPDFFEGKTVFVGATSAGLGDSLSTPSGMKHGVVINAIIYESFRNDTLISRAVNWQTILGLTFLALFFTYLLGRLGPAIFLISLIVILFALYFIQYLLIMWVSVWIPAGSLMLGLVAFYPLWNWFKLHIALRFLKEALFRTSKYDENSKINHNSYSRSLRGLLHNEVNVRPSNIPLNDKGQSFWDRFKNNNTSVKSENVKNSNIKSNRGEEPSLNFDADLHSGHVEVVSRTVYQLQNAMSIAEVNHNLIQQSLSNLQDAVVIINHRGDVVLSNNVADGLFFVGDVKSTTDIFNAFEHRDRNVLSEKIEKVINHNISFSDEFEYIDRQEDGTQANGSTVQEEPIGSFTRHFLCAGKNISFPVVIANKHTVDISILTFSDISKIKNIEQSRLDTLNFLSHDLRSPMVSVLALIEQYQIKEKETPGPSVNVLLSRIRQYVQKNLSYSESLLQLSRAEELSEDSFTLVDLHSVLDSAYQQVLPIANRSEISLSFDRSEEDLWVLGSYDLLERVVVNLLTNGIKFSDANDQINVRVYAENNRIHFLVKDSGRGIRAEDLPSVFDRYSRGENNRTETGAGLGLFFVKTVLNKLNGEISVDSDLGQGTCFHIILPSINPNV